MVRKFMKNVNGWLTKVGAKIEKVGKVLRGSAEVKTRCSIGACLDLKQRHQLSREAERIAKDMAEVRGKGRFDQVSYRPPPQDLIPSTYPNYVMLASRRPSTEGLLNGLRDTENSQELACINWLLKNMNWNKRFTIPEPPLGDIVKSWFLKDLREKWRNYKCSLKQKYFDEAFTPQYVKNNAPTVVNLEQFCKLVDFWYSDIGRGAFPNLVNLAFDLNDIAWPSQFLEELCIFSKFDKFEISKCHGLIELVTSSTANSLVQLQEMSVTECKRMTEIVAREGSEANEVITFSKLTHLKLDWLPKLTNFCSGSYSFIFPSLEEVIVRQCPEMKIFSAGVLSTPKLERVQARENDKWHWQDDLNTAIYGLWEGSTPLHWLWEIDL
ncbi:hypothetical protein CJ030_MR8G020179 [Morella rubra]|uniref:Disease resistance protein At4g27190-like leucine-rich repeats domain-containing protein n=1 Tax=Morella rubra TaxID=262757 RepID=A0A6A1UQ00_9ROSI|nr:hypothetical protein CJ030_MR8G020179 [Morella rubra]